MKVLLCVRCYVLAYSFSYQNTEMTPYLYAYFYEQKNPLVKFEMELKHKELLYFGDKIWVNITST